MSSLVSLPVDRPVIGYDAGWLLAFASSADATPGVELGRDDYNGELRASLPSGLEAGLYEFVIEGVPNDLYTKLKREPLDVCTLYLYWRDARRRAGGVVANAVGFGGLRGGGKAAELADHKVAVLQVTECKQRAGSYRYELHVTARELAYHRLETARLCHHVDPGSVGKLLGSLVGGLKLSDCVHLHGLLADDRCHPEIPAGASEVVAPQRGASAIDLLRTLERPMEELSRRHGRGMFLQRDGVLHVGVRPIPLTPGPDGPPALTDATGLVEVEALAPLDADPNWDPCGGGRHPTRRQFRLTLLGRPDIKPGDVVRFDPPPAEAKPPTPSLFGVAADLVAGPLLPTVGGGLSKQAVSLYVAGVEHRLGRTTGFVTVLTGVELPDPSSPWDCHTPPRRGGSVGTNDAPASTETAAARAVERLARRAAGEQQPAAVAEVRAAQTKSSGERPPQTELLWRGLAPDNGQPHGSRRLDVAHPGTAPSLAAPYATLFAWGKCGLVLPRFPGMRVVTVHRDGRLDDPVDVGALWGPGQAPASDPGDWWLHLPANAVSQPTSLGDDEPTPAYDDVASSDLIDASGNRVIELGELTIRVGRDNLPKAGARPKRPDHHDGVTITHNNGSEIVLASDGSVRVTAKGELHLKGQKIVLEATDVDVKVTGRMDVS